MMRGVVTDPHGTGRKATLEGYSSAGKTGTAQKVDPATHAYSRTKYIASFAGFAPINDPSIVVAVIIDSPVGPHHGADISAPVFQRIAQQILEYLHTPHDIDLPPNRQVLMASRHVSDQDIEEGSPDHLGDPLDVADSAGVEESNVRAVNPPAQAVAQATGIVPAAMRQQILIPETNQNSVVENSTVAPTVAMPTGGTVVVDMEQGEMVVPSFLGKSVRDAVETAEEDGITLDVVGSGLGHQQIPPPGSRIAAGTRVTVQFGR
jgi:cell division protein FtsI (penicillin-binding protein 3)